ncbi:MAG: hypothetical protein GDA48_03385 [Hormoscilla sp. GM102CHS1]|nr:hypothetical protein [Hormoscilla sp. GM102CHS1]
MVTWTVYATIQAAEFGITSENVDDFLDSDDPAIRRFLGVEGDLGESLGLDDNFVVDAISSVGNWQEIYDRNFPFPDAPRSAEVSLARAVCYILLPSRKSDWALKRD